MESKTTKVAIPDAAYLNISFSKARMSSDFKCKSDTEVEYTAYKHAVAQGATEISSEAFKGPVQFEVDMIGWFDFGLCPEVSNFNTYCHTNENAFM